MNTRKTCLEGRFRGIYYKYLRNPESKNTLLFLHGFTGNSSIWDEQIDFFKSNYNLLILDLIGHGKSFSPSRIEEYSFKNHTDKIIGILNKLKIRSFSIVCYSYSCYIGLLIYKKIPKKIESIIFISPYFRENYNRLEKSLYKCIRFIWKYLVKDRKFDLDYSKIKNYEKPKFKDIKYILKCINTKDVLGSVCSFVEYGKIPRLNNFNCPMLIIYGKKDKKLTPEIKSRLEQFKNVEFNFIKNKEHLFLKTKAKNISNYINSFLIRNL
jgi:pimeloyl-ACP methyl ester carboxylesterase